MLRYSDILLMFAEADNELNGSPSAEAVNAVKQVRDRAYVGNLGQAGTIPTDKTGFFNYIVHERLLEFGGEGLRKYDLIRWNLWLQKIAETKQKLSDLLNGTGQYATVPSYLYYKASPYDKTKQRRQHFKQWIFMFSQVLQEKMFIIRNQRQQRQLVTQD